MTAAVLGTAWGLLVAVPVIRRGHRSLPRARAGALVAGGGYTLVAPRRRVARRLPALPRARRALAVLAWPCAHRRGRIARGEMERALPLMLDVLTVASRAGYTPRLALAATARWSDGPIQQALLGVEHRCRLGSSLAASLDDLAADAPVLAHVASALAIVERSGAPTADLLSRLADEARAAYRRRAEAHARRVPVRLLFPLVFLVLPAFGLLTVVPALLMGLQNA
jgi:hypothetical protein